MKLIGIKDSRIENNRIDSPVRATALARPSEERARQAISLRHSIGVELKGNTLIDPEHHTQPDADSRSALVGLYTAQEITLDGIRLQDASGKK
jgi:hypothetical protein